MRPRDAAVDSIVQKRDGRAEWCDLGLADTPETDHLA